MATRSSFFDVVRPLVARTGAPSFTNWAGNHCVRVARVARPRSETELVELVRRAREHGEHLKVVGAGHSWSDIACTDGVLVSLDDYAAVLAVDPDRTRITVQAGIRLQRLCEALRRHGMALSNMGSISEQSIAGAISTATHGSGLGFGNLATQVVSMRLVTGTGEVLELDRERRPEVFRAACVGLGTLGVISTLTLQAERAFNLEEVTENLCFDEVLRDAERGQRWLDEEVRGHEHVKIWWLPHTRDLRVYRAARTGRPATRRTASRRFEESSLSRLVFTGLLRAGAALPVAIPQINRLVQRVHFVPGHRVARSEHVFTVPQVPIHREIEYAVPYTRSAEALCALRELIERERVRVNFIVEARFVAADDLLLSPDVGRDSCRIGAYMCTAPDIERYFERFEQLMLDFGGRPHWGKEFRAGHAELAERLPGLERFVALRGELDPDGVFDNAFTRRVFGG